jgi:NADH dehydrogenase (ubiquinone) 1 alpha subcomplex subunit 9
LDVAEALNVMLTAPRTSDGATFALPGPRTYTYESLIKLVEAMTLKSHKAPKLPKPIALAIAGVLNRALWWPTISPDEVERKYIDDVGAEVQAAAADVPEGWEAQPSVGVAARGVSGETFKGWADLVIDPETIEEHAIKYLRRFRSA